MVLNSFFPFATFMYFKVLEKNSVNGPKQFLKQPLKIRNIKHFLSNPLFDTAATSLRFASSINIVPSAVVRLHNFFFVTNRSYNFVFYVILGIVCKNAQKCNEPVEHFVRHACCKRGFGCDLPLYSKLHEL